MSDEVKFVPEMDFDASDYTMPRWKVTKTGSFINTMTQEEKLKIFAIPLLVKKSRWYWPEPFSPDNTPLCYSVNSVFPIKPAYAESCAECAMADWSDGAKPRCAISYDYLLYDVATEMMSVLSLSRSRLTTARALNSFFKLNGVKFVVSFFTEIETSKKGVEYFQIKFSIQEKNSHELMLSAAQMMLENRNTPICGLITQGSREEIEEVQGEIKSEEPPEVPF
jgi:hypothetical protein